MGAQLIIKDAQGNVVLDLSSRITRFTLEYTAITDATKLLPKQVIRIGSKAERSSYWFLTRYAKTAWTNRPNVEVGAYPAFGVYMCDKAEVKASGFNTGWINDVTSKMDDDSFYIIIEDTRGTFRSGFQNSVTVEIGRF